MIRSFESFYSTPNNSLAAKQLAELTSLDEPTNDLKWQDQAACTTVDPEIFYPEKGGNNKAAKTVCKGCDVREQCLQYALDTNEVHGVWGGLSADQRRFLSRKIGRPAARIYNQTEIR